VTTVPDIGNTSGADNTSDNNARKRPKTRKARQPQVIVRLYLTSPRATGIEPATTGSTEAVQNQHKCPFFPRISMILDPSAEFASRRKECRVFPSERGSRCAKSGSYRIPPKALFSRSKPDVINKVFDEKR
jgi:hypothetical protein